MKALVVEDQDILRQELARLLADRGHAVTACADADAAWTVCQTEMPELILLDWHLPGMDGIELCRRVRALPDGDRAQIVIVSGDGDPDDLTCFLAAGADDYLDKPFTAQQLRTRLAVAERRAVECAERRRTADLLARQAQERELLDRVRAALARELELPALFRAVVEAIAATFGYTQVSLYRREAATLVLQHQVGYDRVIPRIRLTEGISGRVARTGVPVLLADVRTDPAFLGAIAGIVSEVCVPLHDEGKVVGTLNVESRAGVRLGADDLRLLVALGEHVGIAIGRARAYELARASEERYRSVVDQVQEIIFQADAQGIWTFLNPAWTEITRFSVAESLGREALSFVHPDDRDACREAFAPVLRREQASFRGELRLLSRSGEPRWVEANARLLLDAEGTFVGLTGTLTDIAERKRAQEELTAERDLLRSLMDNIPDLIYVKDTASRFTRLNRAAARFFGLADPAEAIGKTDFDFFPEELARQYFADEQRVLTTGEPLLNKLEPQSEDEAAGTWFRTSTVPRRNRDGRIVGLIGVAHDVTEQKRIEEALRHSEARQRALLNALPDRMFVHDRNGTYLDYKVDQETDLLNPPSVFLGRRIADLFPPAIAAPAMDAIHRALDGGGPQAFEYEAVIGDERRTFEARTVACGADEALTIVRDVTERTRAEARLREAEAQYRTLVEQIPAITYIERIEGQTERLLYISPRVETILGFTPDEMMAAYPDWTDLVHPDDRERVLAEDVRSNETGEPFRIEYRRRTRDGRYVWIRDEAVKLLGEPDQPQLWQGVMFDISARKALEERLTYQAFHDPLTRLPNRALFLDRLAHALARVGQRAGAVALLFLDLDDFKVVNDSLGHADGDQLLVAVADRLRTCVRPGDTVARLGGDEFALLLEDLSGQAAAEAVAERVAKRLQAPVRLGGRELVVATSIGIALNGPELDQPDDLLRRADAAMYAAKRQGKAHYAVFDPATNARAWERQEIEGELRRAIGEGELRVYYQPVVDLTTGATVDLEALVRWEHPTRGLLAPAEFVSVAEETGLIVPLGRWVLGEACRQVEGWGRARPGAPPLGVCVNLSPRQFQQSGLVTDLARLLGETGLPPASLMLEVSERVATGDADAVGATLQALIDLGVRLAIDDFGTGAAALSALKRFPVDTLKIDRSFVHGLGEGLEDAAIVRAVVAFAETLGLSVTAEGIETVEQLRLLRALGCHRGQGYYFAPPLPAAAIDDLGARLDHLRGEAGELRHAASANGARSPGTTRRRRTAPIPLRRTTPIAPR